MEQDTELASDRRSEAITWAALSALTTVGKAGVDVVKHFHVEDTIVAAVLDSKDTGSAQYEVVLQITNLAIHGAYLEAARLVTPEVNDFEITEFKPRDMGAIKDPPPKASAKDSVAILGWYFGPGESRKLQFTFEVPPEAKPGDNPFGQVELDITRLHHQKPDKKKAVSFRLRHARAS